MNAEQPYSDTYRDNARRVAILEAEIRALDKRRQEANRAGNPTEADRYDQPIAERRRELERRRPRAGGIPGDGWGPKTGPSISD